jgi:signal peptidase I
MKNKILKIIVSILIVILVIICVLFIVSEIFFYQFIVVGSSMEPTLKEGYVGYACKVKFASINRNDIIIYSRKNSSEEYEVIKRVVGLPNEHIIIDKQGQIYINDEKLDESSYLGTSYSPYTYSGSYIDITLGENEYFTLGDNRGNSIDARYYGPISKSDIKGKVKLIYKYASCGDDKTCDGSSNYSTRLIAWKLF